GISACDTVASNCTWLRKAALASAFGVVSAAAALDPARVVSHGLPATHCPAAARGLASTLIQLAGDVPPSGATSSAARNGRRSITLIVIVSARPPLGTPTCSAALARGGGDGALSPEAQAPRITSGGRTRIRRRRIAFLAKWRGRCSAKRAATEEASRVDDDRSRAAVHYWRRWRRRS